MFKRLSLSTATSRFRRQVRPLIAQGNKEAIKKLFAELTAAACMAEGESALEEMTGELEQALEEPHRKIRRNLNLPRFSGGKPKRQVH